MNGISRLVFRNKQVAVAVGHSLGVLHSRRRIANVAMFHSGRCGSSVLGNLLRQHPSIDWAGEIFANTTKKYKGMQWVQSDPARMIQLRMYMRNVEIFGFETKASHLSSKGADMELSVYVDLLRKLGISAFVRLKRRNQFRALVSALVGAKRGAFHSREAIDSLTTISVDVANVLNKKRNPLSLVEYLGAMDDYYRDLDTVLRDDRTLDLCYEDDIELAPFEAYRKVLSFMGVDDNAPVVLNLHKTTPQPLISVVENFDQVSNALADTKYAWMLSA